MIKYYDILSEQVVPSLAIILNRGGIDRLEEEAQKRMFLYKKEFLIGPNAVIKIPDITKDRGDKITNLRVSDMELGRPGIEMVPETGIRMKQMVTKIVVQGNFDKTILFVPISKEFTLTTSLTVEVTVGLNGSTDGESKLKIIIRTIKLDFHKLDLDLDNDPILTEITSLIPSIRGAIEKGIEKAIRDGMNKSLGDIDIMEKIHFRNEWDKDDIHPRAIFMADRIELNTRLPEEKNLSFLEWHDPKNVSTLPNNGTHMVYLIISKKMIEIILGGQLKNILSRLMKVKSFVPGSFYRKGEKYVTKKFLPPFLENVHLKKRGEFFILYFDLLIDGLIDKIEDVVKEKNNQNHPLIA